MSAKPSKFVEPKIAPKLNITSITGHIERRPNGLCHSKAVELGVTRIIPVICQRTVVNLKADRQEKKHQHWQGIIISACEQSGQDQIPILEPSIKLKDLAQLSLQGLNWTLAPLANQHLKDLKL